MARPIEKLTQASIEQAHRWFIHHAVSCIRGAKNGAFYVNPDCLEDYVERLKQEIRDHRQGKLNNSFTFWQRAYYIQTGESVALLQIPNQTNNATTKD